MRIAIALTGVALGAIAACGKPGPATAPGSLTAGHAPHRKPGLWRQVIAMDGTTPAGPGMQLCVDETSEAKMSVVARRMPGGAHCPPARFTRNLDGSISFSESCDTGAHGKAATTGVIKGDFNSGYTEEMDMRYSGSPVAAVNGEHKMTITATWLGPCAPGQKGGDMILANGMKRNIIDTQPSPTGGGD